MSPIEYPALHIPLAPQVIIGILLFQLFERTKNTNNSKGSQMNKQTIIIGKLVVAALWVAIFVAVVAPTLMPFTQKLYNAALFLIVAHIIEIMIYKKKLSSTSDYIQTMFFGILHINTKSRKYIEG